MPGNIVVPLFYLIGLVILYWIIRKAVAHGIVDAWARRDALARPWHQGDPEDL